MKHTPGPWTLFTVKTQIGSCHKVGPLSVWNDGREMNACIYVDHSWPSELQRSEEGRKSLANAQLIRSAPELLEALKACVSNHCSNAATVFCSTCTEACKVIAKAEGAE